MVINRELPDRPQEEKLTDPVWEMTVQCWQHEPGRRPGMTEVVATLREWQVFLSLGHEHCNMAFSIFCSHRSFISAAQLSTELEQPAASRAHNTVPKPRTTEAVLVSPDFEAACERIDEIAEVIQPSVPCPRSDRFIQEARN